MTNFDSFFACYNDIPMTATSPEEEKFLLGSNFHLHQHLPHAHQGVINHGLIKRRSRKMSSFDCDELLLIPAAPGFLHTERWQRKYQRNYRKYGAKNLRCFPYCQAEHQTTSFCGDSLKLSLDLTYGHPVSVFMGFGMANRADESVISVGDVINSAEITRRLTARRERVMLWGGRRVSDPSEEDFAELEGAGSVTLEFNRERRAWHYEHPKVKAGEEVMHCVFAYVLRKASPAAFECVDVLRSPAFTLHGRKKKTCSSVEKSSVGNEDDDDADAAALFQKKRKRSSTTTTSTRNLFLTDLESNDISDQLDLDLSFDLEDDDGAEEDELMMTTMGGKRQRRDSVSLALNSLMEEQINNGNNLYVDYRPINKLVNLFSALLNPSSQERDANRAFFVEMVSKFLLSEHETLTRVVQEAIRAAGNATDAPRIVAQVCGFLETNFPQMNQYFNSPVSHYCLLPADKLEQLVSQRDGVITSRVTNNVQHPLERVFGKMRGTWHSSPSEVEALREMYSKMHFSEVHTEFELSSHQSVTLEFDLNRNAVMLKQREKLFSSGVSNLICDGSLRECRSVSPLLECSDSAYRCVLRKVNTSGHLIVTKYYNNNNFKVLRAFKSSAADSNVLECLFQLYERNSQSAWENVGVWCLSMSRGYTPAL